MVHVIGKLIHQIAKKSVTERMINPQTYGLLHDEHTREGTGYKRP
jgi:hypothetical protein